MKHSNLIYILVFMVLVFLASVGYSTWQERSVAKTSSPQTDIIKTAKPAPTIPKATRYDVPILMYHYIRIADAGDTLGQGLSVTPTNFAAQMAWLKSDNYATIKVSDLADPDRTAISKILNDGKKPIAITFDDGYADAYTAAYPILQKEDFIATFYIIRNYVSKPEYMNQTQIDALAKNGMEIGSHTLDHLDLAQSSDAVQRKQIFDSKLSATAFCYPSGKYNDITIALVKGAGYTTAVTTKTGIANQDSNLLELHRVRINDGGALNLKSKIEAAFGQNGG